MKPGERIAVGVTAGCLMTIGFAVGWAVRGEDRPEPRAPVLAFDLRTGSQVLLDLDGWCADPNNFCPGEDWTFATSATTRVVNP
jgi:hypothetical protein